MKTLFLAVSAAALTATLPASASIVSFGSTHARTCYLAAAAREATAHMMAECDAALLVQPLSEEDRLATHVNRGILRMARGDEAGARADFNQAIAVDARRPEPWLNLGTIHFNEGDSARALEMFERAIALGMTDSAYAHYARGLAHEETGDLKAAYADLVTARSLNPGWAAPSRELRRFQLVSR